MIKNRCGKIIKILAGIFCAALLTVLTGCVGCGYKGYSGNNPDLYTVAINSLLWNSGHSSGADRIIESKIEVLEKDEHGRTLFTYHEIYYDGGTRTISSLCISQGTYDGYVYYYEDTNYLIKEQEQDSRQYLIFQQEEIDYLKRINDWNTEIDLSKCTKKGIIREKQNLPTDKEAIKEAAALKYNITEGNKNICVYYLTSDNNGNFIAYGSVINVNYELYFVAFVNSEGDIIDWLVPENLYAYQEELKSFKQKNGWQFK